MLDLLDAIAAKKPRLLIVGDYHDHITLHCATAPRKAAGGPQALRVVHKRQRPGGAGLVAKLAASLGASQIVLPPVRRDQTVTEILQDGKPISLLEQGETRAIDREHEAEVIESIQNRLPESDAVIVADYDRGVCTPAVLRAAIEGAKEHSLPSVVIAARGVDLRFYHGTTILLIDGQQTPVYEHSDHLIALVRRGLFLDNTVIDPPEPDQLDVKTPLDDAGVPETLTAALALAVTTGAPLDLCCRFALAVANKQRAHLGVRIITEAELRARYAVESTKV